MSMRNCYAFEGTKMVESDFDVFDVSSLLSTSCKDSVHVERSGSVNINGFQKPNISSNSTDLATFGTSQNGPNLVQALLNTSLTGHSGEFQFVDGQLQSPRYQSVKLLRGSVFKETGFWTTKKGLHRHLDSSKSDFGFWHGDTTSLPKGWKIPTNGKKLRVGVPVNGFTEFVSVAIDPSTNTTKVTGYCIDVFDAVVAYLPYAVSYEYIPFMNASGQPASTYDDLVYQVYLRIFDAVVGEVTIIANRSKYVDFTGDTTSLPKGWKIPTNGKKIRVGVPVNGFTEFVSVAIDPSTNTTKVTGYCIYVFDAVVASLPYAVSYEYIPFMNASGQPAGTYDDLVYQVYLGIFDAVVGEVTILANRSRYVDFTLPYKKSGISMVVPIEKKPNDKWLFVKPLTWDLWLASFISFIVIGMLIWFLEHRINEEFRGPVSHQVGMVFWFSFCTMVFAHKEKITSNLTRFVLIIWFLVVLILTQAYTASLTSMLTVQQFQPKVTDVKQLIKNRDFVGYQQGSFVFSLLKRIGFDESRLVPYSSADEFDQLFTNGSGNGRIAAAFEATPFIDLILAKYCSKYTTVQSIYQTDGFGFVFPIGSPLVSDISRAILNVTEGDNMVQVEKRWSSGSSTCPDPPAPIPYVRLDTGSFSGLFLIVGIAVFSAFVIYLGMFLHEHWQIVTNPNYPVTRKFKILARRFDNKDLQSYTFRNLGLRDPAKVICRDSEEKQVDAEAAPQVAVTLCPQPSLQDNTSRPSSNFSDHTEHDTNFSGEQGCTSEEMMTVIRQDLH